MTFVDESGERRAMMWLRQKDKEQLAWRRRYHDAIYRLFGAGYYGRLPEVNNCIFLTYIDDPEPWEANSLGVEAPAGCELRREHQVVLGLHRRQRHERRAGGDRPSRRPLAARGGGGVAQLPRRQSGTPTGSSSAA